MSKERSQEYRGNGNHEWEKVVEMMYRLRVPGGWIYNDLYSQTSVFVPMPEVVKHAV